MEYETMKFKLASAALGIGLWDMDVVGKDPLSPLSKITWSQELRGMLGFDSEQDFPNVLSSWIDRLHPEDKERALNAINTHIADHTGKTPFDIEYRLMIKNGEYRYFHAFGATMRCPNGAPIRVSGAIDDITDKVQMQKKLENALQQAISASGAKSAFLSSMSHEIRTPLNAIIGMTAIGKKTESIEHKNHALNKIGDASAHLLGVINDILDMAKIEANKLELVPIEYNFVSMLQRVLSIIRFRADEKQQQLIVNVDNSIPHFLIGDDLRLAQVLTNLISNAVKFTPDKGEVSLDISLVGETDGICELRIEVSDNGIGISPEQQQRLFTAFEQAEKGISRNYGGTGLGLAICKHIVECMDGRIWVESELGKGARFIFTVKAARCDKSLSSALAPGVCWESVRILAVDDMADIRDQFQKIFAQLNVSCDVAADGFEASRMIEERGAYDIYFIDYRMPGMDGIELTRKVKKTDKPSIIIMITATDLELFRGEALQAGVTKFLLKPLLPSMVIDSVNEMLGIADVGDGTSTIADEFIGKNLLVVDDIEINREILIALLEDTGAIIDCAENGKEALEMIERAPEKYDFVFMDLEMPKMNGYEATKMIRALDDEKARAIPIVAVTANVFKEDVDRCLKVGMDAHLRKPLDIDMVLHVLRPYLSKNVARREN